VETGINQLRELIFRRNLRRMLLLLNYSRLFARGINFFRVHSISDITFLRS